MAKKWAAFAAIGCLLTLAIVQPSQARVVRLVVEQTRSFADGMSFGDVGPYQPTFPGFPGLLDEDRPFGRVGQWQIALSAGKRRSKRAVDCAEALKRAASPASRRTFAVGACPI